MSEKISHEGIVVSVTEDQAKVEITQVSACSTCYAQAGCMAADRRVKIIDCEMAEPLEVGDKVIVEVKQSMGWLAVLLAFVVPFVLMMLMLWWMGRYFEEGVAGGITICSLVVYFLLLSVFRQRLNNVFRFEAHKI